MECQSNTNYAVALTFFRALNTIRVKFLCIGVARECIFSTTYDCRIYSYPGVTFDLGDVYLCIHYMMFA